MLEAVRPRPNSVLCYNSLCLKGRAANRLRVRHLDHTKRQLSISEQLSQAMATKLRSKSPRSAASDSPGAEHPWLKAYPKDLNWDTSFKPTLLGTMLDAAVEAYGERPCTYFMGP